MRKLSILLMSIFGVVALAACGSGGGGSGDNGGGGDKPIDTPQPTKYSASIPNNGGELISVSNLYVATDTLDVPLNFGAENLTSDTTVNFTVQTNNSISSSKLQATSTLPTLNTNSCTFNAASPQPCTIHMNPSVAPAGSYIVVPSVGSSIMDPISVTTQSASSVTLPAGNYTFNGADGIDGECKLLPNISYPVIVSTTQICIPKYNACVANNSLPIPSGRNPFNTNGSVTNVAWTGTVLTLNWSLDNCPGVFVPNTLTKDNL